VTVATAIGETPDWYSPFASGALKNHSALTSFQVRFIDAVFGFFLRLFFPFWFLFSLFF